LPQPTAPSTSAVGWEWTRPPSALWPVRGEARLAPPCTITSKKSERLIAKEPNPAEEQATYLEEEKARFLFLEASADEARAADAPVAAPPDVSAARTGPAPRAGTFAASASAARAGTSAARAAPIVDCLAAGAFAPTPGDASLAAGAGSGDGGVGSHLSGGPAPQLLPPHPPPRTNTHRSPVRKAPAARAAGTPRSTARGAHGAASRAPSCAPPAPAPVAAPPDRQRGSQG
jgi:hypothetical protein